MVSQSEHIRLPIDEEWFRQSLAEAIIWCTGLPLENDPYESPEVKLRRELARRAGELNRRTYLSNWPDFIKKVQYRRASRMFSRSRLEEIAPLETQLRSLQFKPPLLFGAAREKSNEIVKRVVSLRAETLRGQNRSALPTNELEGGKLLVFSPEETLSDGAARYASKGFFDDDNVPAWDTWVAHVENYVVSWIPPQLIELVDAGVNANPEQCICWA